MAITTNAIANSFKKQLLEATHNFSTSGSGGNTFKLAMYTNSATLGKSTTSYTTGNEVSSSGYTAGGSALVNTGTSLATDTAITDFSDLFTSCDRITRQPFSNGQCKTRPFRRWPLA